MKAAASFFGLGSIGSTYPCIWCIQPKSEFDTDKKLEGGDLKTIEFIRYYAKLYQEASSEHTGKKKLSSKDYYSCEKQPVDKHLSDKTVLLDVYPVPSLHTKLGIVNLLFDILVLILNLHSITVTAYDWAKACGLLRDSYIGGQIQFNGRGCDTLLKNIDRLSSILNDHPFLIGICKPIVACFEDFRAVKESCFGMMQYPRYKKDIYRFATSYFKLMDFCAEQRPKPIKLHVRPKVHATFLHIIQFLERKEKEGFINGLSFYSEQGIYFLKSKITLAYLTNSFLTFLC